MKDRWINAGFEEDELKPYTEPELDITDQKRIGKGDVCSFLYEPPPPLVGLYRLSSALSIQLHTPSEASLSGAEEPEKKR